MSKYSSFLAESLNSKARLSTASHRGPKQWSLSSNETITSIEAWESNKKCMYIPNFHTHLIHQNHPSWQTFFFSWKLCCPYLVMLTSPQPSSAYESVLWNWVTKKNYGFCEAWDFSSFWIITGQDSHQKRVKGLALCSPFWSQLICFPSKQAWWLPKPHAD